PKAVKNYAKKHPHSMGPWSSESKSHVATMQHGDFFHNEKSLTLPANDTLRIVLVENNGSLIVLKDNLKVLKDEIIDATVMHKKALIAFLEEQVKDAKEKKTLFSIHLKATMMKVSDPIIFGHAVKVYFAELFEKHTGTFRKIGIDANNGLGDLENKIAELPEEKRNEVLSDLKKIIAENADLAMVDSDKGI